MGLVKLYTGRDSLDAHHIRAVLEEEGIRATVMGEVLGAARGELPLTAETLPSVWVFEEDARQALKVVRDFRETPPHDDPQVVAESWTCPHCGERIEGQFDMCWKCETLRPQ